MQAAIYVMSAESIAAFLQHEMDRGASQITIRNFRRITSMLLAWLLPFGNDDRVD